MDNGVDVEPEVVVAVKHGELAHTPAAERTRRPATCWVTCYAHVTVGKHNQMRYAARI